MERAVNPRFNSASGQAFEIGFSRSGRGCFADLESPSPQARLYQKKGKFNAIAYRDLGGNDAFIDAMCLWGDAATVKKGLRAHFDAGATHVCLQPVHADGDFAARDKMLAALADT